MFNKLEIGDADMSLIIQSYSNDAENRHLFNLFALDQTNVMNWHEVYVYGDIICISLPKNSFLSLSFQYVSNANWSNDHNSTEGIF